MAIKPDLIIFDLDGTLVDSRSDIADSVNFMMAELGLGKLEDDTICSFVGKGVPNLVRRSITEKHIDKFDDGLSIFREYYFNHLLDRTALYPHVIEILDYFGSRKKAIVTNKDQRCTMPIVHGLNIAGYFDMIVCGDTLVNKKPHPEPLDAVINKLVADRGRTLIVGDGSADIIAGKSADIHTCGLTCGFGTARELEVAGADVIITDIVEMKELYS